MNIVHYARDKNKVSFMLNDLIVKLFVFTGTRVATINSYIYIYIYVNQ